MKWRLATLSLALITLLLLAIAALRGGLPGFSHQVFEEDFTGNGVEMGIYDLVSGQQERYVPFFAVQSKGILMTLTSEENSQFIVKVLLEPQAKTRIGELYSYQPVVFQASKQQPLLLSAFNFMAHNGVTFDSVAFEGDRLLVTPSGLIINQQH